MSLKAFHIFFVCVSILLAFGFGGWELYAYARQGELGTAILGVGSLIAGVGLVGTCAPIRSCDNSTLMTTPGASHVLGLCLTACLLLPLRLSGCAACFGRSDSRSRKA
jgi:hypothetical protein